MNITTLKTIYFNNIKRGKLNRLSFFGYQLLLSVLFVTSLFTIVMFMGIGERLIGGDIAHAQEILRQWFSIPFVILFSIFICTLIFAYLNLTAKRIRDIGFPAWRSLAMIAFLLLLIAKIINLHASNTFFSLFFLALLFTPSDQFNK